MVKQGKSIEQIESYVAWLEDLGLLAMYEIDSIASYLDAARQRSKKQELSDPK